MHIVICRQWNDWNFTFKQSELHILLGPKSSKTKNSSKYMKEGLLVICKFK